MEHYTYGKGVFKGFSETGKRFFVRFNTGFAASFNVSDGKRFSHEKHGFIAYTPTKRKKTAEVDVWVNVYKGSFPATPSTEENHFAIHISAEWEE